MTSRGRAWLAWEIAIFALVAMFASYALDLAFGGSVSTDLGLFLPTMLGGTAMVVIGALIASRTSNPLGWLLLAIPATTGISLVAQEFLDHGIGQGAGYAPIAFWLSQWPFFASLALLVAIFFLFPSGTVGSPGWRWPWRVYLGATAFLVVGFAIKPYEYRQDGHEVANPVGIAALGGSLFESALGIAGFLVLLSAFAAFASLVFRYRGAGTEERQQLRWLFLIAAIGAALFATMLTISITLSEPETGPAARLLDVMMVLLVTDIIVGIPVATGIAIFKYRLYDLNIVVRRTVIVAIMAAAITTLYVAVVVAVPAFIGRTDGAQGFDVLPLAAAALVAIAFDPLRRGARRVADRIVYGERATPYEVLTGFGERVGETYASDDVMPRMAQVLAQGIGAEDVAVWLRVGGQLQRVATWPAPTRDTVATYPILGDALPLFERAESFEVRHQGDLLGALTVTMPPNDPMDPAKEKLVGDLAAQAGLVLRNVGLIEELRASRQRLVAAQDDERRKLERNLHDGAQQQLVALAVQLKLARTLIDRDPAKAGALIDTLQVSASDALDDLRDLARGIYPPLLADKGLVAALESQVRRAAIPTTVDGDGVGRYARDVESAVYFCSLEAMNNIAKYAAADRAELFLREVDGWLEFAVTDDGDGFDTANGGTGTGLQGMADRLNAVGGSLRVTSEPGAGTTVSGRVPVALAEVAP